MPKIGRPPVPAPIRFAAKAELQRNGCIYFTGGLDKDGYGKFWDGERHQRAHRYAFELATGFVAPVTVDHRCHNEDPSCAGGRTCMHRRCIEPTHLVAATVQENTLHGRTLPAVNVLKTHCPEGHPLFGDNLYVDPTDRRHCRTCRRKTASNWAEQNRDLHNQRRREARATRLLRRRS